MIKIGNEYVIPTSYVQKPAEFGKAEDSEEPLDHAAKELFSTILAATNEASEAASAVSKEQTAQLMLGTLDDLPGYQVNNQKSSILFELNLNVRNKVLEAYSEIMKTQV